MPPNRSAPVVSLFPGRSDLVARRAACPTLCAELVTPAHGGGLAPIEDFHRSACCVLAESGIVARAYLTQIGHCVKRQAGFDELSENGRFGFRRDNLSILAVTVKDAR